MEIEAILEKIGRRPEDVTKIYYGGDNVCRCGCKGRYAEKGTPLFRRYMTKMAKTPLAADARWPEDGYWVNLPTDVSTRVGKCFCLYFD